MTALLPSTIDTDSLTDFLSTTAIEIGVRATCEGDAERVLLAADRVERALAGLQARWLKIADDTGVVRRSGARNAGAWLEALTGESGRDAHAKAGVADAVRATPSLGSGLLDGSLNAGQAKQIAATAKSTDAPSERIEALIEDVKGLSAAETTRKARQLERELADETPGERFEQQRRKRAASMGTKTDGSGMFELRAQFDPVTGERVRLTLIKALKNLHNGDDETRTHKQILADALEQLITRHSQTPTADSRAGSTTEKAVRSGSTGAGSAGSGTATGSGTAATGSADGSMGGVDVMVTVTLDDLIAGLDASGSLVGSGETIPIEQIRRIACEQGIIPTVLGSKSEVLDMGRRTRLATPAQKRALKATYRGCGIPGCDVPFEFCDIHHIWYWTKGGPTDLSYLVPVCIHHHHLIHDQGWTITKHTDATINLEPP